MNKLLQLLGMAATESQRRETLDGTLGDGSGNLDVSGRAGYVYIRFADDSIGQARCTKVAPQYNLQVKLRRAHDDALEVVDVDYNLSMEFTSGRSANVGRHAWQHARLATDALYVQGLQFLPFLTRPTDTPSLSVYVEPVSYGYNGTNKYWPGGEIDLTAYLPSNANEHTCVVVGLDPSTNALAATEGDTVIPFVPGINSIPFTGDDVAGVDCGDDRRSAAVRLYYGQAAINPIDIFMELRDYVDPGVAVDDITIQFNVSNQLEVIPGGIVLSDLAAPTAPVNLDGQILYGDSASGGDLYLQSTSHATKGTVDIGDGLLVVDEANARIGLGTDSPIAPFKVTTEGSVLINAGFLDIAQNDFTLLRLRRSDSDDLGFVLQNADVIWFVSVTAAEQFQWRDSTHTYAAFQINPDYVDNTHILLSQYGIICNPNKHADLDFIVETDNLTYGLFVNAGNDQVETHGGRIVETTRVTASPYAVVNTDHHLFVDTDSGAITVNLQAGADGRTLRIINVGSSGNAVTVSPSGAETIRGGASLTLTDGQSTILTYETTEKWW
jgi:hypothetical protein